VVSCGWVLAAARGGWREVVLECFAGGKVKGGGGGGVWIEGGGR